MSDSNSPQVPDSLPDELVAAIEDLDERQLHDLVEYAESRIPTQETPTETIEPQPGEEIVRVTEHDQYTSVVKREPCGEGCSDCPHGPYLYHVVPERHPDGTIQHHWELIGSVNVED